MWQNDLMCGRMANYLTSQLTDCRQPRVHPHQQTNKQTNKLHDAHHPGGTPTNHPTSKHLVQVQ